MKNLQSSDRSILLASGMMGSRHPVSSLSLYSAVLRSGGFVPGFEIEWPQSLSPYAIFIARRIFRESNFFPNSFNKNL